MWLLVGNNNKRGEKRVFYSFFFTPARLQKEHNMSLMLIKDVQGMGKESIMFSMKLGKCSCLMLG